MNLVGMKKENLHLRVDAVISRPKEAQSKLSSRRTSQHVTSTEKRRSNIRQLGQGNVSEEKNRSST